MAIIDKNKIRKASQNLRDVGIKSIKGSAAYARKVMMNSMKTEPKQTGRGKKRKNNPSKPGTPPHSHRSGKGSFRKQILFGVEEKMQGLTAVVGPATRRWAYEIGKIHEGGGRIARVVKRRRKRRLKKAEYEQLKSERKRDAKGRFVSMGGRIKKRIITETWLQKAKYPKRPFAGPALKKTVKFMRKNLKRK